jgi:hypothetical protein
MQLSSLWKGTMLTAVAAAAALGLGLASIQPASADNHGQVRIMHASPDTPAVDIFVDGERAVEGLAFPDDTGYIELPAGTYNVQVFVSPSDGSGDAALEADLQVASGAAYTVLATGLLADGSLGLLPLEDNLATPESGNAHVRLIHTGADAPAVDVLVAGTDTKVFENVSFNEAQGPVPVPAGNYDLEVSVNPDGPVALELPGIALADRTVYTVVAIGLLDDESLTVKPMVDAQAPAAAPSPAPDAPHTGTGFASTSTGMTAAWLTLAGAMLALAGAGSLAVIRRR